MVLLENAGGAKLKKIQKPKKYYKVSVRVQKIINRQGINGTSKIVADEEFKKNAGGEMAQVANTIASDILKQNKTASLTSEMSSCFKPARLMMSVLPSLISGNPISMAVPTITCLSGKIIERLFEK